MRMRLAVCTGLLLLFAAVPATHDVWVGGPAALAPSWPPAAAAPLFRLGTAARPFGWSTAVGDFNADGRPDVIVADRASEWSRNTGYRLDFAISGQTEATDSIQVPDDGVGIRIADVDHDSDLDVVLASTISGRTLGVWLNDGAGHFTRSGMHVAALAQFRADAVDDGQIDGTMMSASLPPRRLALIAPARARAPAASASSSRLVPLDLSPVSRLTLSSASPRAPPALL